MKATLDLFPTLIANAVIVMGFILIVMFISQVAQFNAYVTKPSVELVQTIDITHSIERCVKEYVGETQNALDSCTNNVKYAELTDIVSGKSFKVGEKGKSKREHSIWTNIDRGLWRLYVEV